MLHKVRRARAEPLKPVCSFIGRKIHEDDTEAARDDEERRLSDCNRESTVFDHGEELGLSHASQSFFFLAESRPTKPFERNTETEQRASEMKAAI